MAKPTGRRGAKRKANYRQGVTKIGIARFPKLNKPDTFGDNPDNKYKTDLLGDDMLKALKAELTKFAEEFVCEEFDVDVKDVHIPFKQTKPKKDATAEEKKNFEPETFVKFKSDNKPLIMDAKKQKLPANVVVGSGSKIKVAYTMADFAPSPMTNGKPGITLYLDAVQVIDLVEGGRDAASRFSEEDGWEHTPSASDRFDEEGADGDGDSGDDSALSL